MPPALPRPDEAAALAALVSLQVLDTAPEPAFDALAQAAALLVGVPIALVSLLDAQRQWFKARVGLPDLVQTPREQAFCAHAVLQDEVLEVPDTVEDPRFADNPLVTGETGIRFYAGAPLRLATGHKVGTLCLLDRRPRRLSPAQRLGLQHLATAAASALAQRQQAVLRQQAETALQAEQQRLRNLIEGTHAGSWEWNVATGELRLNARSAAIMGVPPETVAHTGIALRQRRTHPDDAPGMQAAMQAHLRGETAVYEHESRIWNDAGHWVWVHDRGRLLSRLPDGSPEWVYGIHQDISPRKQLEARLQAKQHLLRQVIDSLPGLIAHLGPDGRCTLANRAYERWSLAAGGALPGHTLAQVHGEAGHARLAPQLARAQAGEHVQFEAELPGPAGLRAMQVTFVPDLDARGQVQGVTVLMVDVTALRRAEERLRLVMDASPQGMFISDLDGHCLYTNQALQRTTGRSLAQTLGDGLRAAVHPDDLPALLAQRQAALDGGAVQVGEHRFLRPDGSAVWVRRHIARVRGDASGGAEGSGDLLVGNVEDITGRRLLDQALAQQSAELARSNDDLERFAYVASHDLQEPLRMVTSFGQLLRQRHRDALDGEAREFLDHMVDGGQRAQALIRDLLSLARLDSQPRRWQPVDLQALLAHTLQQLRLALADSGGSVTHGALPSVTGDAVQLGQLLANLVGNALKFRAAAAPQVHVQAQREGAGWHIQVQDNGVGIAAQSFERIFVMFQRLHLRSEHPGTGIGLAICKRVVERHGGRIWVTSTPGVGSSFHFTLPDHVPAPPAPP